MKGVRQRLDDLGKTAYRAAGSANSRLGGIPFLLKRTFDSYNAHDGTFISASMAYYFFFTLFPLILSLIAIGSLFLETERAKAAVISAVSQVLPVLQSSIAGSIDLVLAQRGAIGIVAALGFIYAASGLFGVLLAVVNRIWACPAVRPSYVQRLLAIALVLLLATIFFLFALATTAFEALSGIHLGPASLISSSMALEYTVISLILSLIVTTASFLFLYWKLPATRVRFGDAWPAAVAAAFAWEAVRELYGWYLSRFTNYALVYGSFAAIIGLLAFFYLTGFVILLGAELSAQIAERRGRGPSTCRR